MLPSELSKLTSLKVLSVRNNNIRELPLCLADMVSLQKLNFKGNPLEYPPKEVLQTPASSPPNDSHVRDIEVTQIAVTAHIKRFLKQQNLQGRMETDSIGDESSETSETPRVALKRRVSGRFPVKVNGADLPDLRSPNLFRMPPPIPSRSHSRGLSQQSTTSRRPGVMPLTLGNANERLRSNSETTLRSERPESRNRRMGIVSKKGSDLGTLDETQANQRFSHYRGLSHGSAMQGAPIGPKDPSTPTEPYPQRPVYVRRLSVLPERRRESKVFDPVVEAAKGILYSVFQIHPMIQMLMGLTSDGSAKRSSLEIVFYNTNSHVEELEQEIQRYDANLVEDDESFRRTNENVHRACQTLVSAYGHVCTLLADNIDTFVDNGDARYIRTLLMLLYNSIMELRVTLSSVSAQDGSFPASSGRVFDGGHTIKPHVRISSLPSAPPLGPLPQRPSQPRGRNGAPVNNSSKLRVATDVPVPPSSATEKTAFITSATPRSGESFASVNSREVMAEVTEEEAQFDKIFLSLQSSADIVLRTLPNFTAQLSGRLRIELQQGAPKATIQQWNSLITMCNNAVQQTETMKQRLSAIKLKEPGLQSQASFWTLCRNFISSWTELTFQLKSAINKLPFPPDTRMRLKPIQQSMKETGSCIRNSPWHFILQQAGPNDINSSAANSRAVSPTQVPITPQSAALGPAMQATVPKFTRNNSFAAAFQGNVFDRADALMANPGISMSRPGIPRRGGGHSGLNSFSSVSSMTSDGGGGPPFAVSPSPSMGQAPPRINGGRAGF
jgi:hypothetical protein